MAEKSRSLSYFLFVCALLSGVIFYGCGGGGGTSSSSVPLQISGNVTSIIPLAGMRADSAISPDLRAAGNYAGVTVYLENYYDQHSTLSDADGKFLLSGVPAGSHYLVAMKKLATFTVKVRSSEAISVSDSRPAVQATAMTLQSATASATGRLVDASGNGVPNARMTVWGEPFWTDSNGYYETWPMPANVTAPVIVAVPGYQPTEIEVKFTDNPPFIVQTIVNTATTNRPPTCSLTASRYTVSPGVSVSLAATASDPDQELDSANYSWSLVDNVGTFSGSLTGLQVSWRAPADNGVATITFTVTDNGGLKSQSSVQIVVGTGVKIPNDAPTEPVISCDIADPIYTGSTCKLTAVATDSDGDVLTFRWKAEDGTIGEWGATTNWVTPTLSETATFTVTVVANDGKGGQATGTRRFTINYIDNDPPYTPQIMSPANNLLFSPNAPVNFIGSASDPQDGILGGSAMAWYIKPLGGSESLIKEGAGLADFNYNLPSIPGTYSIRLQATDKYNVSASASINLRINQPPAIAIVSPLSGSSSAIGLPLRFTCAATDVEDGNIAAAAIWTFPAPIGVKTGNPIDLDGGSFAEGSNQPVRVTVKDSKNEWAATATINISIVNDGPTVDITSPADNSAWALGANVTITGSGTDNITKMALPAASMTWKLYDGKVATYTLKVGSDNFIASFSETGIHVLTLTGSDQAGKTTSTSHRFSVNTNPTVAITLPASGTRYDLGAVITFNANVTDSAGEESYLNASWSSSIDGYIGIASDGKDLFFSNLSSGSHVITCQGVNTRSGLSVSTETMILVNTLPVATITYTTATYTMAPGNRPVFLSTQPSMPVSFSVDSFDAEINGTVEGYNNDNVKWFRTYGGVESHVGTGSTLIDNLPVGISTITVRLFDSFYPAFADQASNSFSLQVHVWQSRSFPYASTPDFLNADAVDISAKAADLTITFNTTVGGTPGSGAVRAFKYVDGLGVDYFDLIDNGIYHTGTSPVVLGEVTSAVQTTNDMIVLGASTSIEILRYEGVASFTHTTPGSPALTDPTNITSDGTRIYICDNGTNAIMLMNPSNFEITNVVYDANDVTFSNPKKVRYSNMSYGKVFVADYGRDRVVRYGSELLGTALQPVIIDNPIDMGFSASYMLVMNETGTVTVIDPNSGKALMTFGGSGPTPGKFDTPVAVFCSGKDLFVLEASKIQVIRSGVSDWLKE